MLQHSYTFPTLTLMHTILAFDEQLGKTVEH